MLTVGQVTQTAREVIRTSAEQEWVEFKHNLIDHDQVGAYLSALANSAAIAHQKYGFVIWGVEDATGAIVGTNANPWSHKVGNEDFIPWLRRGLSPESADFEFHQIELEQHRMIVLAIAAAHSSPVQFKGHESIRDGSYTKDLRRFPNKARQLWQSFDQTPFESRVCVDDVTASSVIELLNVEAYCSMTNQPQSTNTDTTMSYLEADKMVARTSSDRWDVLNLGALCIARRFDGFPRLQRKAVRFVAYSDASRSSAIDSIDGQRGYAAGFEGLLNHIEGRLPHREVIDPIRRIEEHFPRISVRELIANALIHQDLTVTGAGPLVELFPDRLEISSPGVPLVSDTRRLLDCVPQSRNEDLASFMRKCGICEERGSGIDKAALAAEEAQLPAPEIRVSGTSTIAILLGPRKLSQMDPADRQWATYLHAALRHVNQQDVTNATVRARFGIQAKSSAQATRLLRDAVRADLIRPKDPEAGPKNMKYVPFWA